MTTLSQPMEWVWSGISFFLWLLVDLQEIIIAQEWTNILLNYLLKKTKLQDMMEYLHNKLSHVMPKFR